MDRSSNQEVNAMIQIAICPSCGSDKIKRVRRNWTSEFQGQTYTVRNLEFYECGYCGEKIYDRCAMRKIEAHSPDFAQGPGGKQIRVTTND